MALLVVQADESAVNFREYADFQAKSILEQKDAILELKKHQVTQKRVDMMEKVTQSFDLNEKLRRSFHGPQSAAMRSSSAFATATFKDLQPQS